jgi:hypothetical protein
VCDASLDAVRRFSSRSLEKLSFRRKDEKTSIFEIQKKREGMQAVEALGPGIQRNFPSDCVREN